MGTTKSKKMSQKNDSLIHASTNDKELVINYCCDFMLLNKNSSYLTITMNMTCHGCHLLLLGKKNLKY